jgi:phosphate transport system permease protein
VKFGDTLARALITIGGIGTIVAVLMVFVFLFYVAYPLFLPARVESSRVAERTGRAALLVGVDENQLLRWELDDQANVAVARLQSGEVLSQKRLLDDHKIESVASSLEWGDFALGLDNGKVVLGAFQPQTKFYRAEDLPAEVVALAPGEAAAFESGVIARTPQGMYRWQAVEVSTNEPLDVCGSAIKSLDFAKFESGSTTLAAVDTAGRVMHLVLTETRNILDEVSYEVTRREIPLPKDRADQPPARVFVMGRGNMLLVLWSDGHAARFSIAGEGAIELEEERDLIARGAQVTAATTLQGRYTLVVGDSAGRVSAWFTASVPVGDTERVTLVKAHELPPLDSAVTSFARSRLERVIAAGAASGEVKLYFVTSDRLLATLHPFEDAVGAMAFAPNDDALLAVSQQHQFQAQLNLRHPEASFASLFLPVWYEDYPRPLHKWQSTAGTQGPEPKFGLMPLVFGTLKATLYSMLFGVPIALLAAVYTSEFVDPAVKAPLKSLIEMMASVPSVVLGFLAGLVFAPFVEDVLPTLIAALFTVPFSLLLGAQLWQLFPRKATLRLAKYRLLAIALMILLGVATGMMLGPAVQSLLFAGDFKAWLNRQRGAASGGWFVILLPLAALAASLVVNAYVNPWMRQRMGGGGREQFALFNLLKFLAAALVTVLVAYLTAIAVAAAGFDPRGSVVDTYVQRNALVVGVVMGFAIIPIIYTISEDALSTVPQHLRSASLGCGATPWQTTWRIVVPTAASGLFSAVMVGMGRAVGETMIMLMATGNVPLMDINIFNGFRSLSANIAEELPEVAPWSTHFRILFLTGLTLLVLTFLINTAAEAIRISFRRRASQL